MFTTPQSISPAIRQFCNARQTLPPLFVGVRPEPGSMPNDCANDVRRCVMERGGAVQHGWIIWECPGVALEAQFHAVWEKPDGELLDVSFKRDSESLILFSPDPVRVFIGRKNFASFRVPLIRHPLVSVWAEAANQADEILNAAYEVHGEDIPPTHDCHLVAAKVEAIRRVMEAALLRGE